MRMYIDTFQFNANRNLKDLVDISVDFIINKPMNLLGFTGLSFGWETPQLKK